MASAVVARGRTAAIVHVRMELRKPALLGCSGQKRLWGVRVEACGTSISRLPVQLVSEVHPFDHKIVNASAATGTLPAPNDVVAVRFEVDADRAAD
jgi:hypothetical protein